MVQQNLNMRNASMQSLISYTFFISDIDEITIKSAKKAEKNHK